MYICTYIYICIVYICIYVIYISIYVHICIPIHMYVYICMTNLYINMCAYVTVCVREKRAPTHTCVCTCMFVRIYISLQ